MYKMNDWVDVVVYRERGGFCVKTEPGQIVKLGETKVLVQMQDGKKKRVAFSSIQTKNQD